MLTAAGCRRRRERLWAALPEKPDWILLSEPRHLTYFAGYYPSPFDFATQNAPALLALGADGSSLLIADNLLHVYAEASHVDAILAPVWYRSRESAPCRPELLIRSALEAMKARPGDWIGVDGAVPAPLIESLHTARTSLQTNGVGAVIRDLNRRKDPDEIALMRRAAKAAEAGFAAASRGIRPGMTELQAYALVQNAAIEAAGEQAIVYGDFVSGPRTEAIGGPTSARVIETNDLFILDFSVVIHGYRCDFANTFVVDGGTPTARQRELAAVCHTAMGIAESRLKAGAVCREVDHAARGVFVAEGLGENFPHHVGHGLGLGHPDPPYFVPESSDILLAGDIVTVEPGVYVKGAGGMRFERNYLITETGYELLSRHAIGLEPLRA